MPLINLYELGFKLAITLTGLAIIAVGILVWSNTKASKKWLQEL